MFYYLLSQRLNQQQLVVNITNSKKLFCYRYRENVKMRSKLMHDQPIKPIDLAVYWIEFVIRHKGAPHLRSAGLDLKWYQREMIDIICFLILAITALFIVFYITLKKILKLCFKQKPVVTKIKKIK